jgi:hypothetical protein
MTAIPKNRDIVLGDRTFSVPPLPIRINRVVYPICRKLVMDDLLKRCIDAGGELVATSEELDQLIQIAFLAASAADSTVTQEQFDQLAITPPQLLDAFFLLRYQTGAWVEVPSASAPPLRGGRAGEAGVTAPTDRLQRATGAAGPLFRAEPGLLARYLHPARLEHDLVPGADRHPAGGPDRGGLCRVQGPAPR